MSSAFSVDAPLKKRNEFLSRIDGANSQEELAEAELDVFHAKMNRYLYEAAHETTSETNIKEYQTMKWREAARSAENGKKRQIPHANCEATAALVRRG